MLIFCQIFPESPVARSSTSSTALRAHRRERPGPLHPGLERHEERHSRPEEHQVSENRLRRLGEIREVPEGLGHSDVREHQRGEEGDSEDQKESYRDPHRQVRADDPVAARFGFARHVEDLARDAEETRFGEPLADAISQAFRGLDDFLGANPSIHDPVQSSGARSNGLHAEDRCRLAVGIVARQGSDHSILLDVKGRMFALETAAIIGGYPVEVKGISISAFGHFSRPPGPRVRRRLSAERARPSLFRRSGSIPSFPFP
jgi:hypothetical protein